MAAPRIKDVAARAGVSVATVSNTLNKPDVVRAEVRQRVHQAIADLGYVRNESARALRMGRSRTVGMIVPEMGNPFFTDVAEGAESVADTFEATLMLCGSSTSLARQSLHLERMEALQVQGILITPLEVDDGRLARVATSGTPVVVLGRHSPSRAMCEVFTDDVRGGYLACAHAIELGHTRIAFVGSDRFDERLAGAKQALVEAGLAPDILEVSTDGNERTQDGRRAGDAIAEMPARRRPTALLCGNDLLALGVLQAMISHGAQVPDDMTIIGYDDISYAASAAVPLTSVRQPRAEIGRAAAQLLFEEISAPELHKHRQLSFQPELVVRASSAPPGRARKLVPPAPAVSRPRTRSKVSAVG